MLTLMLNHIKTFLPDWPEWCVPERLMKHKWQMAEGAESTVDHESAFAISNGHVFPFLLCFTGLSMFFYS